MGAGISAPRFKEDNMALIESLNRLATAMTRLAASQAENLLCCKSQSAKLNHVDSKLNHVSHKINDLAVQGATTSAQVQNILNILNRQFSSIVVTFKDILGNIIPIDFLVLNISEGQVLTGEACAHDALGNVIDLTQTNTEWTSSDPTLLTATQAGVNVNLSAVKPGTAQLIMKVTPDNGYQLVLSTPVEITSNAAVGFEITLK